MTYSRLSAAGISSWYVYLLFLFFPSPSYFEQVVTRLQVLTECLEHTLVLLVLLLWVLLWVLQEVLLLQALALRLRAILSPTSNGILLIPKIKV